MSAVKWWLAKGHVVTQDDPPNGPHRRIIAFADAKEEETNLALAAPELLRALEVAMYSMERNDEPGSRAREGVIEQARAAIAKARDE